MKKDAGTNAWDFLSENFILVVLFGPFVILAFFGGIESLIKAWKDPAPKVQKLEADK